MFAQVLNLSVWGLFPSKAHLCDLGKTERRLRNCHMSWWPKGVLVSNNRDTLSFGCGGPMLLEKIALRGSSMSDDRSPSLEVT